MKNKTFIKLKKAIAILTLIAFFIQPSLLAFASDTVATPDPNQGKNPIVEQSANGTTVVNIREPNKNGLSHNQYLDLQIGQNGIIFNNSSNISSTQLGGLIHGNMYAGPGGAKIILNEVTGHLPTNINGYMEVAGNRADLIIANPNGIVGNNFGFINTNRAVLTTGNPLIDNGKLNGFNVTGGSIAINGNGMDASSTSKTDLVAQVVKINATVNAQNLNIITGKNKVGYDGSVTALADQETGVGLDVSALGSMYSNRITLIGTGKGVGVNSVGNISAVGGDLILNQNGQIVLKGDTYAKTNISMVSKEDIIQEGNLYAKGNINLQTDKNIQNNSGIIKADNNLTLNAANQINNNNGQIGAGNNLTLTSTIINNQNTLISNTGQGVFTINATTLNNTSGKLLSDGSLNMTVQNITNSSGLLYSAISTQVVAAALTGDGQILSTGNINLKVDNGFTNNNKVQANGSITITSLNNNITNNQDILAGQNITLTAKDITNQGSILANNNLNITAQNSLTNNKDIKAANDLNITVNNLDNQQLGTLLANNIFVKATTDLNNKGLINASLTYLQAHTINNINTGRIYGDNIALKATNLNNIGNSTQDPVIAARNQLNIGAQTITNKEHAILLSEGDMYIGGDLDNSNAVIGSSQELNNNSATIEAGQNLVINADTINNTNDHFEMQLVEVEREYFTEYQGSGQSQKYLAGTEGVYIFNDQSDHLMVHGRRFEQWNAYRYWIIKKQDQITLTDPGKILSGQTMQITSTILNNDKSKIVAGGSFLGNIGTLNNIEADGRTVYQTTGTITNYWRDHQSGRDRTGSRTNNYNPANIVENLIVDASTYQQNTVPPTSGQNAGNYVQQDNDQQVTEGNGPITIPGGGLFGQAKDPDANYIIETDPNFTNYKKWASSDYFFEKMQYDPERILKRLGDAYYEQKLIKDQIIQLTSNRYLDGFDNDDTQYMQLMDNAVEFANNSDAIVGVALNKEQLDGLTESIVWMVEKEVILPTGQIVKALVPQVYLVEKDKQSTGSTVISAKDIDLNLSNDLVNAGTIKATNSIEVSATNINNLGGVLSGKDISLEAQEDINNIGGSIIADNSINLTAGRDVNIESTTNTQKNAQGHTTNLASVGTVMVTNEDQGNITINAGRDINVNAGAIINQGEEGKTSLNATNDINLGTIEISDSNNIVWDSKNKRQDQSTSDVGSNIYTAGNLELNAGNDVNAKAAYVTSDKELAVNAGNDINITAGRETSDVVEDHFYKGKSGGGNSMKITTHDEQHENLTISSTFSGDTVTMNAGNDLNIKASNVIGTNDVNLNAGNNINITTEQESTTEVHNKTVKKSGLMSTGGFGFTIGTQKKKDSYKDISVEQKGSTIGSTEGSININAGKDVNIKASDIVANQDINIEGDSVTIEHANNVYTSVEKHEFKQTGLSISLSGGFIDVANSIYQPLKRAGEASDDRLQTVSAIKGGYNMGKELIGWNKYNNAIKGYNEQVQKIKDVNKLNAWGGNFEVPATPENPEKYKPESKNDLSINISFGTSKSVSETNSNTVMGQGSNISAGGDVNIKARDKDLTIKGSTIDGENITLQAAGNVNIEASSNTNVSKTDSKSSSSSIGVGINLGSGGITGTLEISKSKGNILENGTTWNESIINANGTLTIESGKDLNIIGSQVKGDTVKIDVGENLNIESLQDTDNYKEKQTSGGISVSVSPGPNALGGSGSMSNQKIESEYTSVKEQAGIFAGEGGFEINVGGNTDLIGSVIASEADASENKISTETITFSDLENHAEWSVGSTGVNVNVGKGTAQKDKGVTPSTSGSDDEANSTTHSAVAEGEIEIRDKDKQEQDIEELSRDTENANNPLEPIFDRDKILERQEAAAIFGELGFTLIGDIADRMNWKEGSPEKIALHALIGGIMAEINNGNFGEGLTVGAINELLIGELSKLKDEKGKPIISSDLIQWISSGVGNAIGGNGGAGIAESATKNNYLTHDQSKKYLEERDACRDNPNPEICMQTVIEKYQTLYKDNMFDATMNPGNYILYDELVPGKILTGKDFDPNNKTVGVHTTYNPATHEQIRYVEAEKDALLQSIDKNGTLISFTLVLLPLPGAQQVGATMLTVTNTVVIGGELFFELAINDSTAQEKTVRLTKLALTEYLSNKVSLGEAFAKQVSDPKIRKFIGEQIVIGTETMLKIFDKNTSGSKIGNVLMTGKTVSTGQTDYDYWGMMAKEH